LRVKIASERPGCHGDVANTTFDKVSGERCLGEDSDLRTRVEGIYLREYPASRSMLAV